MLYSEIKDFRDEVNILSSAAHYQLAVQKRLTGNKVKTADLSASYVLEDLEKMDRVANRIELAVSLCSTLIEVVVTNLWGLERSTQHCHFNKVKFRADKQLLQRSRHCSQQNKERFSWPSLLQLSCL